MSSLETGRIISDFPAPCQRTGEALDVYIQTGKAARSENRKIVFSSVLFSLTGANRPPRPALVSVAAARFKLSVAAWKRNSARAQHDDRHDCGNLPGMRRETVRGHSVPGQGVLRHLRIRIAASASGTPHRVMGFILSVVAWRESARRSCCPASHVEMHTKRCAAQLESASP